MTGIELFLGEHLNPEKLNALLLLGVVLFGGTWVGRLFQLWKIPQVVGYIGLGLALGNTGLGWIDLTTMSHLQPFSTFALGLIGFMIGGELKIKTIKKYGKQFTTILLMESLGAFVVVSILITLASWFFFKNWSFAISLGLLMGSISSATAPAATTDVLWENKTKGPLTTIILGIVAMDDAVALLLFAVSTSVVGILMGNGGDVSLVSSLLDLVWEVGMAVVMGAGMGFILYRVIRSFSDEDKILAFSIGAILLLIGLAIFLGVDIILAAMSMGFFITNFAPRRSKETFHLVERFTPPVFILFFVMVGAKLDVKGLTSVTVILAVIYLLGRIGGKSIGAITGSAVSRAPRSVLRYLPFSLLSQAGVAIGLSIVAGQVFPGPLGDTIVMVVTATTFVVQLAGPPLVKFAITRAGEVGLNITEEDLIRQSRASDIADKDIPTIKENADIKSILKIFAERDNLYYPVVNEEGVLTGILPIEKLKDTFIASDISEFLLALDIMDQAEFSCRPDTEASEVRDIFKNRGLSSIPVVDENGIVYGMIEYRRMQQLINRRLLELKSRATALEKV
ncbi:MAG: cation:proton antiporter [Spirochaetaceae bacterium]|nr:cation:proton antiporter [Spirochaetaceae bacterium]